MLQSATFSYSSQEPKRKPSTVGWQITSQWFETDWNEVESNRFYPFPLISLLQKIIVFRQKKSDPAFPGTGFGKDMVKDTRGRCRIQQLTRCPAHCLSTQLLHNDQAETRKLGTVANNVPCTLHRACGLVRTGKGTLPLKIHLPEPARQGRMESSGARMSKRASDMNWRTENVGRLNMETEFRIRKPSWMWTPLSVLWG